MYLTVFSGGFPLFGLNPPSSHILPRHIRVFWHRCFAAKIAGHRGPARSAQDDWLRRRAKTPCGGWVPSNAITTGRCSKAWAGWLISWGIILPNMGMDQYLLIPFLGGWTSINPSYFDVNRRGTVLTHCNILIYIGDSNGESLFKLFTNQFFMVEIWVPIGDLNIC